jgi:hypothetical protein
MRKNLETANPLNEVKAVQWRLCSAAITAAVVVALIFMIFGQRAVAKGLVLGTCFSMVNFFFLGRFAPLALGHSRPLATMVGLGSIFLRYAILALPMIIAVKAPSINFAAVVVGIFAVQIVTLFEYLVIKPIFDKR